MIVADTSVLIKLVIPEPDSDLAAALRIEQICAPALWVAETANVLWRKARVGEISQGQAVRFHGDLLSGGILSVPMEELATALLLAITLDHPVYNCFFLEAAIQKNAILVTSDTRFAGAVKRHRKWARHIRLLDEFSSR